MKIIPSKHFEKQARKLRKGEKQALAKRLTIFMEDPYNRILNNNALGGSLRHYRSINITGDLRLIYEAQDDDIARLIDLETHAKLYKK